jgi:hypothetical protein
MKQIIIAALLLTGCNIGQDKLGVPYRYRVDYQCGKWNYTDYTNRFEWVPNHAGIAYVDEKGDTVVRVGTFSVKPNR